MPLLPMALIQALLCYAVAGLLGMKLTINVLLAVVVSLPAAALFIGPLATPNGALRVTGEVERPFFERIEREHPLVRLSSVAVRRASDGRPLDIEALTQWLAQRAGLDYLRIDSLKVDVAKVADAMSAAYAERHHILPIQVTAAEVVVATAEP